MHLTLRLSRDLARAVSRWAKAHGVAKSQVVREAVASYVGVAPLTFAPPEGDATVSAHAAAVRWARLPRLSVAEAESLADDVAASRASLPPIVPPWE